MGTWRRPYLQIRMSPKAIEIRTRLCPQAASTIGHIWAPHMAASGQFQLAANTRGMEHPHPYSDTDENGGMARNLRATEYFSSWSPAILRLRATMGNRVIVLGDHP